MFFARHPVQSLSFGCSASPWQRWRLSRLPGSPSGHWGACWLGLRLTWNLADCSLTPTPHSSCQPWCSESANPCWCAVRDCPLRNGLSRLLLGGSSGSVSPPRLGLLTTIGPRFSSGRGSASLWKYHIHWSWEGSRGCSLG